MKAIRSRRAFQKAAAARGKPKYVLSLYVSGLTPRSTSALANIREICAERFAGHYELRVIDIYLEPERAKEARIVAVPTLIKQLPAPLRRLIGDLSDREHVLRGLDLKPGLPT